MKQLNKATKTAVIALVIVVALTVPIYFWTRQNAGTEGSIQIKGAVNSPINFTYSQLEAFTPVTVTVTLSSSSHPADNGVFNYTGVRLSTLLERAQIASNATSVYIQAADGYGTAIPLQDAQKEDTIIAYMKDGVALTPLSTGGEGPFRLIIGDDQYAQRWTRGVSIIEIR